MDAHTIYTLNAQRVYNYLFYRYVGQQDIEDLMQEVFLRFFAKYPYTNLDELACTKLIYRITSFVYLEWCRQQKNTPYELFEEVDHSSGEVQFLEDAYPDSEVDFTQLKLALEQLHPNLRDVLTLRFLEGLSRQEDADRLQIPMANVHVYQKRGIKALRKLLNEELSPAVPPLPYTK